MGKEESKFLDYLEKVKKRMDKEWIEEYKRRLNIKFSIKEEEALAFLALISSIDSSNSKNGKKILKIFESFLNKVDSNWESIESDKEGVISKAYIWEKGEEKEWVIINTHYDVIPANRWEKAFKPELKEENGELFLYGRGVNDNKFGLVVMLLSLKELLKLNLNICLMVVGDEEKGGKRGTKVLLDKIIKRVGKNAKGVVLEPTANFPYSLKIGVRGKARAYVKIKGEESKTTAEIKEGVTIFLKYLFDDVLNSDKGMARFNYDEAKVKDVRDTQSIMRVKKAVVKSNVGTNPVEANLELYFRYFPEKRVDFIKNYIKKLSEATNTKFELKIEGENGFIGKDERLQNSFIKAINKLFARKGFKTIGGGGSDAKYFNAKGIEVVEFGVNPINIHSKGERVRVRELFESSFILIEGLGNYSKFSRT